MDLETAQGVPPTPHLLRAVLRLYAEGAVAGHGFTPRAAVTLPRRDPWSHWPLVQELALGLHGAWLTGIDFCSIEEGHPPRDQRAFFAAVHDFNRRHPERALAILYHVGESFSDKSLESAIRWVQEAAEFGAHRLGHAIALGLDPAHFGAHERAETVAERRDQLRYDLAHAGGLRRHGVAVDLGATHRELDALAALPAEATLTIPYDAARLREVRRRQDYALARVRASGAIVEVCPTSNRRIGGIADPAHHPVQRFLAHDLPFVIGADDPGIFGTGLREEIDWVIGAAGLPPGGLRDTGRARLALSQRNPQRPRAGDVAPLAETKRPHFLTPSHTHLTRGPDRRRFVASNPGAVATRPARRGARVRGGVRRTSPLRRCHARAGRGRPAQS